MGMFGDKPEAKPEEQKDAPSEAATADKLQDKLEGSGDKPRDIKTEIANEQTSPQKNAQEGEGEKKTIPVANTSSTREIGPAKKSARTRRSRGKNKAVNQTAPTLSAPAEGGGGEIQLELRGLNIESVDKEKGLIIVSPKGTPPTSSSTPDKSSLENPAPGTEVKGKVVSILNGSVFCDIGQARLASLVITVDMAEKLRCGDELSLVVGEMNKKMNRTIVALTPAAEQEVFRRTPSRKPLSEFEVGMEVDGYIQTSRGKGPGLFVDVHGPRAVIIPWRQVKRSGIKYPQLGDHLRLKLVGIEVETGRINATILT